MNFNEIRVLAENLLGLGIKVSVNGDKLKVDAPQGVMTEEIGQSIKSHKEALIKYINSTRSSSEFGISTNNLSAPLTLNQIRIYELQKSSAHKNRFNIPTVYQINGPIDHNKIVKAIEETIRNNGIFNTIIDDSGDQPLFLFFEKLKKVEQTQLTSNTKDTKLIRKKIQSYLRKKTDYEFNLNHDNAWHAELLKIHKNLYYFIFTCHHIIFDGISKKVFLEELSSAYNNAPHNLKKISFLDFANWADNQEMKTKTKIYWENQLNQAIETIILPVDKDSHNVPDGSNLSNISFNFADSVFKLISEVATTYNCNIFTVILSTLAITINKFSHQKKFCVLSPFANRQLKEISNTVGYFNNVLPIYFDLSEKISLKDLLFSTRKNLLDALDYQNITLTELAQLDSLKKVTLNKVMVTIQDSFDNSLQLSECKTTNIKIRRSSSDFDLAFYFEVDDGKLRLSLDYNNHFFSNKLIGQFVQSFANHISHLNNSKLIYCKDIASTIPNYEQIENEILCLDEIDDCKLIFDHTIQGLALYVVLNEHLNFQINQLKEFYSKSFPKYLLPKSFITLDKLPRRSDGLIDIDQLPKVNESRNHLSSQFKAPETELQKKLCSIWKDVLWLNFEPGILDHFIELGGHSLLAVHLVATIQSRLSITLSSQALSRLSTIEQLEQDIQASLNRVSNRATYSNEILPYEIYSGLKKYTATWQGYRHDEDSVMVGLNVHGTHQPIYWCLQRYYELTQLAKYLGPDQPVFGMRSGNMVMEKNDVNIQKLAQFYAHEILQVSSSDHFILGGNCQAAKITFQIAKYLKSLGKTIDLLILHEKFIPEPYDGRVALMFGQKSSYHPQFSYQYPMIGWRKYYKGYLSFNSVSGGHGEFFTEPNIQSLVTTIQSELALSKNNSYAGNIQITEQPLVLDKQPQFSLDIVAPIISCAPLEKITLTAKLTNNSGSPLPPWRLSGLATIGRWVSKTDDSMNWHHIDGYHQLSEEIRPHSDQLFTITICAPNSPGYYSFMYDLIEEGISWLTPNSQLKMIDITVQ